MERWACRVAVVTGAGKGVGLAIVHKLVEAGLVVAGMDLNIDKLVELRCKLKDCPGKIFPMTCDITQDLEIVDNFKKIKCEMGPISVLINNSGLLKEGYIHCQKTEDMRHIFEVNVIGLCTCAREAIQQMISDNIEGHVINVNSISGHSVQILDPPALNVYPASKFAVTAVTETLRQEMNFRKKRIKISSISPGVIKSEKAIKCVAKGQARPPRLSPKHVADAVIYILSTPPHVQVHDLIIKPAGEPFL